VRTRHWHRLEDGRVQCDVCPRACKLQEGAAGVCFVRARMGDEIVLRTYGRSSGFAVDPIEKKPLNHFLPGTTAFSFGTAGCNLACSFCQNWEMSKSRDQARLAEEASPEEIARAAKAAGCRSVAFTYNEPIVSMEYAIDTAEACHAAGIKTVAVTNGYICSAPREEFFGAMDAANVDLKGFTERFYREVAGGRLGPVLETLEYVTKETKVHLEVTTLLIPGENDSENEIEELTKWVAGRLGAGVPLHFSAFHPAFKMTDKPATPRGTVAAARKIAMKNGLRYVYTGNVHDPEGASTFCHKCGAKLIGREGYTITEWGMGKGGKCRKCGTVCGGCLGNSC
jgi:pyruvate formate lyase activating enzyme